LIEWNEYYSVNVKLFDEQHRGLIDIINRLEDTLSVDKGSEIPGEVLQSLVDYTHDHFSAEERFMSVFRFPGCEEHKKEHRQMFVMVHEIDKNKMIGNAHSGRKVVSYLKDWLIWHIEGTDRIYGPFFNSKGIF
jgi:hemerythrin